MRISSHSSQVCLLVNFHRQRRSIGLPGVYVSTASVSSIFLLNCDWKSHLVQHGQSRVPQPIHRGRKIRNTAFKTGLLGLRDPVLVDSRPTKIERSVQEPRANIHAESNIWPFFEVRDALANRTTEIDRRKWRGGRTTQDKIT